MLKTYFKLAWRNLWKNRLYSLIIISGITVAYAACMLIYLHVDRELSYDRHIDDAQRVYRVVKDFVNDDGTFLPDATTPPALIPAIRQEIPEVEEAVRVFPTWGLKFLVRRGETIFYEDRVFRADSNFFRIFNLKFVQGQPDQALSGLNNLVLTESAAHKYFGDEDALNQTLELRGGRLHGQYLVTAVIRDLPSTMHFHFDMLIRDRPNIDDKWEWYNWYSYIKLKPGARIADVEPKIVNLFKAHHPDVNSRYYTQALTDLHLKSHLKWELEPNGDASFITIFVTIGIFIMLIASVNYINLSIVQALNRAREVGIRKVSGALQAGIIRQFVTESVLFSVIALVFAIALVELLIPTFNAHFGTQIAPVIEQPSRKLLYIVGTGLTLGVLSGLYPAFYMSSFRPAVVLKGLFSPTSHSLWLRKALVVLQFTISIALMAGMVIVVRQTDYLKTKDLGFDKEQVIIIENVSDVTNKQTLKDQLKAIAQVENVGGANTWLGGLNWTTGMVAKGSTKSQLVNTSAVDYDYLDALKMKVVMGRGFSRQFPSDTVGSVVLNERAVKDLGIEGDPIGAQITDQQGAKDLRGADSVFYYTVVGVVKDFHFASLRQEIKPFCFFLREKRSNNFAVRVNANDMEGTLRAMKRVWSTVEPNLPFEYTFLDTSFAELYQAEDNFKTLFSGLTAMAIYIACSGLFAIASYFIRRRTKEIGIRKVLGASGSQIVWLVSAEFLVIIALANLIAWPMAFFSMDDWLNSFAYRVEMSWTSFVLAGGVALVIAFLTISVQSVRAARANPVDALRAE